MRAVDGGRLTRDQLDAISEDLLAILEGGLDAIPDLPLTLLRTMRCVEARSRATRRDRPPGDPASEKDDLDLAITSVVEEAVFALGETRDGRAARAVFGFEPDYLRDAKPTPRQEAAAKLRTVSATNWRSARQPECIEKICTSLLLLELLHTQEALDLPSAQTLVLNREDHFAEIWAALESLDTAWLLLFGGVASQLCDENAERHYARWLVSRPDATFFCCYESGENLSRRAELLDGEVLDEHRGLSADPHARMLEKESHIRDLQKRLSRSLGASVLERVHFIPLDRSLTTYFMVTDQLLYQTPMLARRSSVTFSIKLGRQPPEPRQQVIHHILFELGRHEPSPSSRALVDYLTGQL